jgi:hypothetical protein
MAGRLGWVSSLSVSVRALLVAAHGVAIAVRKFFAGITAVAAPAFADFSLGAVALGVFHVVRVSPSLR